MDRKDRERKRLKKRDSERVCEGGRDRESEKE